jgi:uncharacterized DUF497 family protein
MPLRVEWDPDKAERNLRVHGVSFEEAASALMDPLSRTIPDPDHSEVEDRYVLIGYSLRHRLIVVVHSERRDTLRIISARRATRWERQTYEEHVR